MHFIVRFCLFPWGKCVLFIPKWTIPKMNCHYLAVHLATICCDLFTLFFWSCGERRQLLFHGRRTEGFIKLFPNKGIISDKIQLAMKRWLFFSLSLSRWEIPHDFSFSRYMGKMGTWGGRVNNAHLRHVTSRTISWCTESETHTHKKKWTEGGHVRERKIEEKIDTGREG